MNKRDAKTRAEECQACLDEAKKALDEIDGNRHKVFGAAHIIDRLERRLKRMKTLLVSTMAVMLFTGYSQAQNSITNVIPPTVPTVGLEKEQFAIWSAAVTEGEQFRAAVGADWNFSKLAYVRAEVQTGNDGPSIDSAGIGIGIYKSWPSARIYGGPQIGYSWTQQELQGSLVAGVAYQPMHEGILDQWAAFSEFRLLTPFNNKARTEPPHRLFFVGIRRSF